MLINKQLSSPPAWLYVSKRSWVCRAGVCNRNQFTTSFAQEEGTDPDGCDTGRGGSSPVPAVGVGVLQHLPSHPTRPVMLKFLQMRHQLLDKCIGAAARQRRSGGTAEAHRPLHSRFSRRGVLALLGTVLRLCPPATRPGAATEATVMGTGLKGKGKALPGQGGWKGCFWVAQVGASHAPRLVGGSFIRNAGKM